MFEKAIVVASHYTRPIHIVSRSFASKAPQPGAGTVMLLNDDGWALTCKHVAAILMQQQQIAANYTNYKTQLAAVPKGMNPKKWQRQVDKQRGMLPSTPVQLLTRFVNCVDVSTGVDIRAHATLDIALVKFRDHTKVHCSKYPVFAANESDLAPGKFLCRLGYPFADFSNFSYDQVTDQLQWTAIGRANSPLFPLDGMVTRMVANPSQTALPLSSVHLG